MELNETTYVEDESYQQTGGPLRASLDDSWRSTTSRHQEILRNAAIPLLIVVCIILYFEPKRSNILYSKGGGTCAEQDDIWKLKPFSTGKVHASEAGTHVTQCLKETSFPEPNSSFFSLSRQYKTWKMVPLHRITRSVPILVSKLCAMMEETPSMLPSRLLFVSVLRIQPRRALVEVPLY
jgi:hypothetical protein